MYSAVVALDSIERMTCWFEAGSVYERHIHFSYFKDTEFKMFTTTDLDKRCLKMWMKKKATGMREMQRDESTVEEDECRWTTHEISHLSPNSLNHRAVRGLHTKCDTCTPPIWTPPKASKEMKKKNPKHFRLWDLKTIVSMCKEAGL